MNDKNKSRSSLVLMEIIVTVCLFMLCGAVCIKMFANAYTTDKNTKELNNAVIWCSSAIEIMDSQDDCMNALADEYPKGKLVNSTYYVYYDEDYKLCDKNVAKYSVRCSVTETEFGKVVELRANAYNLRENNKIYELTTKKYIN